MYNKTYNITDSHNGNNGSNNKQKVRGGGGGGGGLNAFYWYQIFALDSAVVEVQEMFSKFGFN